MKFFDRIQASTDSTVLKLLLLYAAIIHAGLFIYDLLHPDAFLKADRALQRYQIIDNLLPNITSGNDLIAILSENGIVGDYLVHGLLYMAGGQYGVIAFQLMLLILSLAALFQFALLLTRSRWIATVTLLIYIHLPHTLVFPHQLASEAIFNPLVIFSFYYLAIYIFQQRFVRAINSALMVGFATIVRPLTILWPLFVGPMILATDWTSGRRSYSLGYVGIALLPLLLWMWFMFAATGNFSIGSSNHSMPQNLHKRVKNMIGTFPKTQREELVERYLRPVGNTEKGLTLLEYLDFVVDHPYAYTSYLGHDALLFWAKSGINRIVLDYSDSFVDAKNELRNSATGYRTRWEKEGLLKTVVTLIKKYPMLILTTAAAAAIFIALMLLAILGMLHIMRRYNRLVLGEQVLYLLLFLFPFYTFFVSQVVDAMQSRHRAPAEFALCIFAAIAVYQWSKQRKERKDGPHAAPGPLHSES